MTKLWRLPIVLDAVGIKGALLYRLISEGRFVRPVKISDRASAWPSTEVQSIIDLKIRGGSDDELKRLVRQLHAARASAGITEAA